MPIPALPLFKHRDTVVTPADQNQFVTQFENTMDTMSNDVIPALNLAITDINEKVITATTARDESVSARNIAVAAKDEALTAVATLQEGAIDDTVIAPNKAFSNQYVENNYYDKTEVDTAISDSKVDRIGLIDYGYVAKPYHIVAFGGEFNRADYPKLWAYLQANPSLVKTQAQWQTEATANGGICGFFSSGNGTTTFRVPNLDKAFLRPDSRGVGSYQGDAIRNIIGEGGATVLYNFSGALYQGASKPSLGGADGAGTYGMIELKFDASRVVPTANENRPKNIAVLPLIVAK